MLRTHGRSDGRSDNVKTVYPPTNTVCRGYNDDGPPSHFTCLRSERDKAVNF